MKKTYMIMFLAVSLMMASACKDEEPAKPAPQPTKKEMISKTWKPVEVYVDGQLSSDPYWGSIRLNLKSNETYTFTDATDSYDGVWEFNSDQTKIILDKGDPSVEETFDIINLSTTQWKAKSNMDGSVVELLFKPV